MYDKTYNISNMKIRTNDTQQYVYCFTKGLPQSLVVLEKPDKIPQLTLSIGEQAMFIWVVDGHSSEIYKTIKQTQIQLGAYIFVKSNLNQLQKDIKQKRTSNNLVVIHSPQIYDQIIISKQKISQIKKLICFSSDKLYHSDKNIDSLIRDDRKTLVKWLQHFKGNSYSEKLLPNFLFLNSDQFNEAQTSNLLMRTIYAMSNLKLNKQTNDMLINSLEKVVLMMEQVNKIYKNSKILTEAFFNQLRNGMDQKSAIKWYTRQSIVNKITNNLLRSARRPTQVFYLYPYFSKLFHSIQLLYKSEQNTGFKCYRGGKITDEQISFFVLNKNSKKIVQNLGFLSTSKNYEVANSFSQNVLFEIQVPEGLKCDNNHCYAEISKYSQYFSESQIIFNPLNLFELMQVSQTDEKEHKYIVCLKYKSFTQQKRDDDDIAECEEQKQFEIYKNWDLNIRQLSSSQSVTFAKKGQILPEFYCYWQKYMQIVDQQLMNDSENKKLKIAKAQGMIKYLRYTYQTEKLQNIKTSLQYCKKVLQQGGLTHHSLYLQCSCILGQAYLANSKYLDAVQLLKSCVQEYKKLLGQDSRSYYEALNILGTAYNALSQFSEALQIFQRWKSTGSRKFPINSTQFITNQINIATVLSSQGYREKAKEIYVKYLDLFKKSKGEGDSNYLSLLRYLSIQYFTEGKLDKALQLQRILISTMYENNQEDTIFCLKSLGDISQTYHAIGKAQKSSKILKKVISKLRIIYGKEHILIAKEACKLGKALKSLRKYTQSFYLLKLSLVQTSKLLGYTHIDLVVVLHEMGLLFKQKGDFWKSIKFFILALKLVRKQKGRNDLKQIPILHSIGAVYLELLDLDTALAIFQKIVDMIEKTDQKQQIIYSICLCSIGLIFRQKGDIQLSILFFKKSLDTLRNLNTKREMTLFLILNRLAYAYILSGAINQSIETSNKCIQLLNEEGYQQNPEYLQAITNLANAYQRKGMIRKSIGIYKICQTTNNKFSQRDNTYLGTLFNNMGCAYKMKGKLFLALKHFKISYDVGRKMYGSSNQMLLIYLENYASCFLQTGRFAECIRIYTQFLERFKNLQSIKLSEGYLNVLHKLAFAYIEKGDLNKCAIILKESKERSQSNEVLKAKFSQDRRKMENFLNKNYLQLQIKSRMGKKIEWRLQQLRKKTSSQFFVSFCFQIWIFQAIEALVQVKKLNRKLRQSQLLMYGHEKLKSFRLKSKLKQIHNMRSKLRSIETKSRRIDRQCFVFA